MFYKTNENFYYRRGRKKNLKAFTINPGITDYFSNCLERD
jgi:hypothetical protein